MSTNNTSRILLLPAASIAAIFLFTACLSKGDINSGIIKGISVGAERSEVKKHLDSLAVNGIRPVVSDFGRETEGYTVPAPDGKKVEVRGKMSATFSNGLGGPFMLCNKVVAIFYFDKSDKLITWITDC
jgi:hypothetical protein